MKTRIFNISFLFLAVFALLFNACQPEDYELGDVILKENLKYSITQDAEDPNMIILKSENPGMTPFWITPMGRSIRVQDTVRIPFEGEYNFVYGAQSRGGIVQADTFKLVLTTTNLNYVNDPLWTLLSGGVGEEKTWLLDLDADGVSKYFIGPLFFYGTEDSWESMALYESGKSDTEVKAALGIEDSWFWEPDWAGNSWLMDAADFGSMTFSLKGNATVSVDHKTLDRVEQGTYFLDASAKTLRMTDAGPLHDLNRDGVVIDWGNLKLMSLTENTMQLAALRDPVLSGEGATLLVYNFISKDYSDNWVPDDVPDPEPQLPDGWMDDVSQVVSTSITWKLSEQNPIDWANLDGSRKNGWNVPSDYPDWLGTPDPDVYGGFSLTMNSVDGTVVYVAPDGSEEQGTYTLDDKGIYTFTGISPQFTIINWASFGLTADNQLRILSVEKDQLGNLAGMWVGVYSAEDLQYTAYHLEPSMGGAEEEDPVELLRQSIVDALTGTGTRTFVPDTEWFVDWVGVAPDFAGGWTSASTFADYTSNGWVWDEAVADIATSASITFSLSGEDLLLTVAQKLVTEHVDSIDGEAVWTTDAVNDSYSQSGTVLVDAENETLTVDIPLVSYAGTTARWLSSEGNEGGGWFLVSHGDSNYTNIAEKGLWLGYTSKEDETTIFHYLIQ
jgi:hypothetical protein